MFLCLFLEIPLFYCLQTIENNRKTMGTIDFRIFFTHSKSIDILCLLTSIGDISITTAHFMDDSISFEIYWKYIGFAVFKLPTFTKTSIFFNRCFFDLETSQKNVKQATLKSGKVSQTQLLAFLSYSKSNNRGGHYAPPCKVGLSAHEGDIKSLMTQTSSGV